MAQAKKLRPKKRTAPVRHLQEPSAHRKGCVLFVDDEELLVQIGQEMLAYLGYETVVRTRSIEALAAFRATPDQFDLVVTDYDMPQMSGEELARQLRDIRPDIPIILCTGGSIISDEDAVHQLGFDTLLRKPFRLDDIASAIALVITHRSPH
jgi:CheY-like chemotaxis protein